MSDIDELDRLHADVVASTPSPMTAIACAAIVAAWPEVSARLRAAETDAHNLRVMLDEHRVEVKRLRRLCRVAAERIDDDALALAELLDDQDAPVDGGALTDALSRAARGES